MREMKSLGIYWLPVIAYMALVFYVSGQSKLPLPESVAFHDKMLHASEYAVLSALAARAFLHASPLSGCAARAGVAGAALAAGYALTDEMHQAFVPARTFDPWDLAADCAGALLALLAFPAYARRFGPRFADPPAAAPPR